MIMSRLVSDFFAYLKELFWQGIQIVFSIFEIAGIAVFFWPLQNPQVTRLIGGIIFVLSFLIANFALFRKYKPPLLDQASILLYQYRTKTSNAVRIKYTGAETAGQLVVKLSCVDPNGVSKETIVNQFFPPTDPEMLYHAGPLWSLDPGQEAYFYLPGGQETRSGIVTVHITFKGTKTGTCVETERTFPLANTSTPLVW